jgi:hypothetical protein
LSNLFRSRGFQILRLAKGFDDQYLLIDAVAGEIDSSIDRGSVAEVVARAERFGALAARTVEAWRRVIDAAAEEGETVVLWGASSKAVAFLAAVDRDDRIMAAVDINPFKQGMYLPGSGVAVVAPERLKTIEPEILIVMNPIYLQEINANLGELDLRPEVRALGEAPALRSPR